MRASSAFLICATIQIKLRNKQKPHFGISILMKFLRAQATCMQIFETGPYYCALTRITLEVLECNKDKNRSQRVTLPPLRPCLEAQGMAWISVRSTWRIPVGEDFPVQPKSLIGKSRHVPTRSGGNKTPGQGVVSFSISCAPESPTSPNCFYGPSDMSYFL